MSTLALISSRLKVLRTRHGLTQEQAAELTGLAYKHYQSIEAGRRKHIWLETVERLAHAYGLQVHELVGPELPEETALARQPSDSKIHYSGRRGA